MPDSVAIIMRAKDEMPYVRQALDMLKRQTFTDFELCAVDSGSTDGTLEELETHCGNLVRIARATMPREKCSTTPLREPRRASLFS